MHGEIIAQGQSCTVNGCQTVTIAHKGGGDIDASLELQNKKEPRASYDNAVLSPIQAEYSLKNPSVDCQHVLKNTTAPKAKFSLVCETSTGDWEYLLVDEGALLLINGEAVMVRRKRN